MLAAGSVYWLERSRGPGWGDSLAFLLSAVQGFSWSVNATAHFLYAHLNAGLVEFLPWADPVVLLTVVSIIFALLTLARVYQIGAVLTGDRYAAMLAALAFGFSFTFWRQAEQVEVYTCAAFLTASALHAVFRDVQSGSYRHVAAAGIWFGLAALAHIQTVLLLPFFLLYVCLAWRAGKSRRAVGLSLSAAGGAFLLLIVPAAVLPEYTVGSVFFSFGFREEVFHFSLSGLLGGFGISLAYLAYAFHVHLPAMLKGFLDTRREAPLAWGLALTGALPVWAFAMRYPVSDQYVFFLDAYLFLAVFCAFGYRSYTARLGRYGRVAVAAAAIAASPLVYGAAMAIAPHVPRLAAFGDQKAYKGGLAYYLWPGLRAIPDFETALRAEAETGLPPQTVESELWSRLRMNAREYHAILEKRIAPAAGAAPQDP
jgi:hypothetical protein